MIWIFIGIVIVAIAAVILIKLSKGDSADLVNYPYQSSGVLFTPAERSFYGVLEQSVGGSVKVLGKVRVADVITPKKGLSRSEWQKAFNKISAKHFDFVLCKNDDLSIICAIELDDSSHNSKNRQKRDVFLKGACEAASIPLIQVPAKSGYVIGDIKGLLAPYLEINENNFQVGVVTDTAEEMSCPKCSSPLVIRTAKKGANAGKQFLACSAYPKCKHVEAINA
jgi:hypothetical protein